MTVHLTDYVWQQVDPSAARLVPRTRRRVGLAIVVMIAAIAAGASLRNSGVVVPRFEVDPGWSGSFEYGDKSELLVNRYSQPVSNRVSQSFSIRNNSWSAVDIVGLDMDRPGIRVERVTVGLTHFNDKDGVWRTGGRLLTPEAPYTAAPTESVNLTIYYEITECRSVTAAVQPIPLRIARPFGVQTIDIELPPLRPETGGWMVSVPEDPDAVQWQRFLADHVCGIS